MNIVNKSILFLGLMITISIIFTGVSAASTTNTTTYQSQYNGPQTNATDWIDFIGNTTPASLSNPIIYNNTIYIGDSNGLYAYNHNGTMKWEFKSNGAVNCDNVTDVSVASDGTIYYGGTTGKLYAINPNGTIKWTFNGITNNIDITIGNNGIIYLENPINGNSNNGENLLVINPNGTLIWKYNNNTALMPAIAADGTIYITRNGGLTALNPNGTTKWNYNDNNTVYGSYPIISPNGNINYITSKLINGTINYYLKNLNPNGVLQWTYKISNDINMTILTLFPLSINNNGTIYMPIDYMNNSTEISKLYAINPDGTTQWIHSNNGLIMTTPIIGADGLIYYGTGYLNDMKGSFTTLNSTSSTKWTYQTGMPVGTSSIAPDGTLYVIGLLYTPGSKSTVSCPLYAFKNPLKVTSTNPIINAVNVNNYTTITITFNEKINSGPNSNGIQLLNISSSNRSTIPVSITIFNNWILITSSEMYGCSGDIKLSNNTVYEVFIPCGAVEDYSGSLLHSAYAYCFSTGNTIPAEILTVSPAGNNVSLTTPINIKFNENIKPGENYSNIYIKNLSTGNIVSIASKTINGNTLTITTTYNHLSGDIYQVYIPVGAVTDAEGLNLTTPVTYTFTTTK